MDETKPPGIRIAQIFLGKSRLEHRPDAITQPASGQAGEHQINIQVGGGVAEDGTTGLATITVQTLPENTGCYQFLVEMVGIIEQEPGAENMSISDYLMTAAAPTMFPFLREAVANLTGRGRFGPVWLKPMNFSAMVPQQQPDVVATGK